MSSVNRAIILGNVGKDPEIRTTAGGKKLANFSIATSRRWRDRNSGEREERTSWHRIVVFNEPLVEVVKKYVRKGSKVYVQGSIETREYEKDGERRFAVEIVLRPFDSELVLLDKKDGAGGPPPPDEDSYGTPSRSGSSGGGESIPDDEIPF